MSGSGNGKDSCPAATGRDRYSVALDAALDILETIDTLPKSDRPARLGNIIFIVLDAIYEAEARQEK